MITKSQNTTRPSRENDSVNSDPVDAFASIVDRDKAVAGRALCKN